MTVYYNNDQPPMYGVQAPNMYVPTQASMTIENQSSNGVGMVPMTNNNLQYVAPQNAQFTQQMPFVPQLIPVYLDPSGNVNGATPFYFVPQGAQYPQAPSPIFIGDHLPQMVQPTPSPQQLLIPQPTTTFTSPSPSPVTPIEIIPEKRDPTLSKPIVAVKKVETSRITPSRPSRITPSRRSQGPVKAQQKRQAPPAVAPRPTRQKKFAYRSKQKKIDKVHGQIQRHFASQGLFAADKELVRGDDTLRIHVKTFDGLTDIWTALREIEHHPRCEITRLACVFSKKNKFQKKGFIVYLKVATVRQVEICQSILSRFRESLKNVAVAYVRNIQSEITEQSDSGSVGAVPERSVTPTPVYIPEQRTQAPQIPSPNFAASNPFDILEFGDDEPVEKELDGLLMPEHFRTTSAPGA